MTLRQFALRPETIPTATAWYLADLGEALGKQELFTRQSPQKLRALREHALIESAISSNRIEGVTVEPGRIGTLVFGKPLLKNREEEEVRGYRDVLKLVHERPANLPVTEDTLRELHRLTRGEGGDAGEYKRTNSDIIEKYADGRQRMRFKTLEPAKVPDAIRELVGLWDQCVQDRPVHPLLALAGFNLDFLCIHPFRDGNGRVSRLLLLLQAYHLGYEVGRYISLERLIEENKERYYETLEESSQGWHRGKHDPWPYVNYVLYILKTACREFERRAGQAKAPRGAKTELVESAVQSFPGQFTLAEIEKVCPGVSRDMIRRVLRQLKAARRVECIGRGPGAPWRKRGNTSKRG